MKDATSKLKITKWPK